MYYFKQFDYQTIVVSQRKAIVDVKDECLLLTFRSKKSFFLFLIAFSEGSRTLRFIKTKVLYLIPLSKKNANFNE